MVIFVSDCAEAVPASATTTTAAAIVSSIFLIGVSCIAVSLGDRLESASEGIDGPAEGSVSSKPHEAQNQQGDENLVDEHVKARVPDHLAKARVSRDELSSDDCDKRVAHGETHAGQNVGHGRR